MGRAVLPPDQPGVLSAAMGRLPGAARAGRARLLRLAGRMPAGSRVFATAGGIDQEGRGGCGSTAKFAR
jgi:hypothetical protein